MTKNEVRSKETSVALRTPLIIIKQPASLALLCLSSACTADVLTAVCVAVATNALLRFQLGET